MKVKTRFSPLIVSQLSDWELIAAYSYCNRLLNPRNLNDFTDFEDISIVFFDGNSLITRHTLAIVKKLYVEEYSKRHCN